MEAKKGIWKVSLGNGDRMYIDYTDESKIIHPLEIFGINRIGIYGYENLKDLAIAILRLEKEKQLQESILSEVGND